MSAQNRTVLDEVAFDKTLANFERAVSKALSALGVDFSHSLRIGLAVSGGADSVSLLMATKRVLPSSVHIVVLTVNHNLRPAKETEGDALFVEQLCKSQKLLCLRKDIPRGAITALATQKNIGIEAAARIVRYEFFEECMQSEALDFLCLAHTSNDQVETLLMRFFQGGDSHSLSGIPQKRGKYIRPLLGIERSQIEAYLTALSVPYRTDSSNASCDMLRNKIRNKIIPLLDKELLGWRTALASLEKKMRRDDEALAFYAEAFRSRAAVEQGKNIVSLSHKEAASLPKGVLTRVLYDMADSVANEGRVPYAFIDRVLRRLSLPASDWSEEAVGIVFFEKKGRIFAQKRNKVATESGFFAIIEEGGTYAFSSFSLTFTQKAGGIEIACTKNATKTVLFLHKLCFPFIVRSRQQGDMIRSKDGTMRSVSGILSAWKCGELKDSIPLIQELTTPTQEIICLVGFPLGFSNWKV